MSNRDEINLKRKDQLLNGNYPSIINIDYQGEEKLRVLFISDLHIGSSKDRLDCVERACEYAISNQIKYILNLGDFIENVYTGAKLRLDTIEKQIDCIVHQYPCDRRLTHLVLYGNHDYYYVPQGGIDVSSKIEEFRPDIISLGYGRGYVGLGNDYICLEHECPNRPSELINFSKIKFVGHSHMYKINNEYQKAIYVPALSDEAPTNYSKKPLKGFLDINFDFNANGVINKLKIQHYVDNYGVDIASQSTIALQRKRKQTNNPK